MPAQIGRDEFFLEERDLTGVDSAPRLTAQIRNTLLQETREVEIVATIFNSSGGFPPSESILPERSIARITSVGTSQLRSVVAIGNGHVKITFSVVRPWKYSTTVRAAVSGLPEELKIVATISTSRVS